jgi:hypothetical protein
MKDGSNNKEIEEDDHSGNKESIIEYPLNYEEIVKRKLEILNKDYEDTIKCNFDSGLNLNNDDYSESDDNSGDISDSKKDGEIENKDNGYYQCLNNCEDEEFLDVCEEDCKNEENDLKVEDKNLNNIEDLEFVNNESNKPAENIVFVAKNPVKDPEKIKNAMKSITMKPPKWAEK